ncbi:Uncharacterized protein Adt_49241 [Abeliophyllum distichum]|uniref:Ripening-related protein 1 n=1 Tax=Abeliophyllum distichum TaxID=126358 RepID=A0ABD1NNR6_9LAMI
MKNSISIGAFLLLLLFAAPSLEARLQVYKPSGKIKGKKPPPGQYDIPVVALSTGWYNGGRGCLNNITISDMVVEECDSTMGCDVGHDYQPPCANNIVDALKAVWKGLRMPEDDWGWLHVT